MSVFSTSFAASARGAHAAIFGESATYTPRGGAGVSITVRADPDMTELDDEVVAGERAFGIDQDEVSDPGGGDVIAFESRTYRYSRRHELMGGSWIVITKSD